MNINPVILEAIKKNHNMITTAQVIQLGFTRSLLSKYVQEGLLEREHQGIYTLSNTVFDDMYSLMLRSDKIIFSHDTALFLNGLLIISVKYLIAKLLPTTVALGAYSKIFSTDPA